MSMSFKASPDGTFGEILVNGAVVAKLPVTGNAVIPGLVGTVSQSGGVPTGAVVERGSNANGEYVRFADGTQICRKLNLAAAIAVNIAGTSTPYRSAAYSVSLPASFVQEPTVTMSAHSTNINAFPVSVNSSNSLSDFVFGSSVSQGSSNVNFNFIAIGRWF